MQGKCLVTSGTDRSGARGGSEERELFIVSVSLFGVSSREEAGVVSGGHSVLVIVYHLLSEGGEYEDLGANYFDERDQAAVTRRCVRCLEPLGYEVRLEALAPVA